MKRVLVLISLYSFSLCAFAQADLLMSPEQLAMAGKKKMQMATFLSRTEDGEFLFSDKKQLYLLTDNGVVTLSKPSNKTLGSAAQAGEFFISIIDRNLCFLDTLYHWKPFASLPSSNMGMRVGYSGIYLYETKPVRKKYSIYVYRLEDQKTAKILESPEAITSVVETGTSILFSTLKSIYVIDIKQQQMAPVYRFSGKGNIQSIIWDEVHGVLFFSTNSDIYIVHERDGELQSTCILDNAGGYLCEDPDGLVVFSPQKNVLFRLRNEVLFAP